MYEVLNQYLPQIKASDELHRLHLESEHYFLVSSLREENIEIEKSFIKLVNLLNTIAEDHQLPVIISTQPRSKK